MATVAVRTAQVPAPGRAAAGPTPGFTPVITLYATHVRPTAPPVIVTAPATRPADSPLPVTASPRPVATPSRPVRASPSPSAPVSVRPLSGIVHQQQTFNNCGPATLSMQLSALGASTDQAQLAKVLRPDKDDRNVSPVEMAAQAERMGYRARVIEGADLALIKSLLANGLPAIVETWFIPKPNDEMGHYRLLVGYEGDLLQFYDSYMGPNIRLREREFDPLWKVFNRAAIVVWKPSQEELARRLIGERMDERAMRERALAVAREEARRDPTDKFAWFNAGTNLLVLGDAQGAARAFDTARSLQLPWRMMWYQFGPYAAYHAVGRHADVLALANETLRRVNNLEESYYWRGMAHRALGNPAAARADFARAVELNSGFAAARAALQES